MNDYYSELVAMANSSKDSEVCGFLLNNGMGGLSPYQTRNVSPEDHRTSFEISLDDQKLFMNTGRVEAIFHSHVEGDSQFSKDDVDCSERSGLPIFVYSLADRRFNLYVPAAQRKEYYHRRFIAGLRDCYQLISDYYSVRKKCELPYVIRTQTQLKQGITGWKNIAMAGGLKDVPISEMQKDDILLMSIMDGHEYNHLAIYAGDGLILHQLLGCESDIKSLTPSWRRAIKRVFRV